MKQFYKPICKIWALLLLVCGFTLAAHASDDGPGTKKKESDKPLPAAVAVDEAAVPKAAVNAELHKAFAKLQTQLSAQGYVDKMEDLKLFVPPSATNDRSAAAKVFNHLDNNPDKVLADINYDDLFKVPVGIKEVISDNSEIMLGISEVNFFSDHAEATIFVRYKFMLDNPDVEQKERDLFFGVSGVRISRSGGMKGTSGSPIKLVLLGDFPIPMKSWTMTLKGAASAASTDLSKTFIQYDCGKFAGLSIAADVVFPRNVIVPFNETTREVIAGNERVTLQTYNSSSGIWVGPTGLRDLVIPINTNKAFAVAGFEKFGFKLQNAIIDLSDKQMGMPGTAFPAAYSGDKDEKWRGLYIGSLSVLLSKEFKSRSSGGNVTPFSLNVSNTIIDRSGFTGQISATGNLADCDASKWRLTLNSLNLGFVQNRLTNGGFGGGISTPMTGDGDSDLFQYDASVNQDGSFLFSVNTVTNTEINFKCWPAKGKIYAGSKVELLVQNGQFYPSAYLSGEVKIGGKYTASESDSPTYTDSETINFKGIQFTGLSAKRNVTTGNMEVGLEGIEYVSSDNSRIANFPVVVTKLSKEANANSNIINIGMGLKISLAQNRFSGTSTFTLKSEYIPSTGKLKFKGFQLKSIRINGSTTAMDFLGYVNIFDNATDKGFDGTLIVAMKKPFPFGVDAQVKFGYDKANNYRYGYASFYASSAPSVVTYNTSGDPIITPGTTSSGSIPTGFLDLGINGVGLGVYFNMKPVLNGTDIEYIKDKNIAFGFKAMVGIQNKAGTSLKPTFLGRVSIDFSMNNNGGINNIALWGNGVFTSEYRAPDLKTDYVKMATGNSSTGLSTEEATNKVPPHTQNSVSTKARTRQTQADIESKGDIAVALGFMLDFEKKFLHAEAEVYINTSAGGMQLVGINNGLAGRGVIHIGGKLNGGFYVHLGSYYNRIGIRLGNFAEASAYLMIGRGVPSYIPVDPDVQAFFGYSGSDAPSTSRNYSDISTVANGNGFAFGAKIKMQYNLDGGIGYIIGDATAGLDVILASNPACNNKFRANGRLYGIVNARAGIYIFRKKVQLFSAGLGVLLEAQGFAPSKFNGQIGLRLTKRKTLNFGVTLGKDCYGI
ncbi:hypothetical protein [Emticicia sp. 21SJ11W-3]|uniref:hypothetical protein n=1 Tax=Emticicia sp. 21SJ11W-3 TaxID=2916755 RepID=UPI0020A0D67E|nr:hypothetical protein [Emticicia sp. 21SJ11W-3]UTA66947.1 hypothetical protein MB380_15195 [Emticicia sp. 21SJ11W-3]